MTTQRRSRRSPAPGERQRDPERTKARIIEAAIEEFSAKGFAGARVSEIAAKAGVNQQLIAYYFDGKEGLYLEIGRRWRAYEAEMLPDDLGFPEMIKRYVRASVDKRMGGKMLAWAGLADTGEDPDDAEAKESSARLRHEVEAMRERQKTGDLDPDVDPAAMMLIAMSAGNALAVYPQIARALFGKDGSSPELVEHYANELAKILTALTRKP
ncbi:TetR family transcriptional regulator [Labedaea rhizosphaerae]|uniref:TetR family transcriptional regulator n=2 Tax=Labedaea rhizosphaerae TaxID=598644 RepID=A0A4R6SIE8_LABRH|nr:TetR family transcriptional regulator [Labedaea rhizosphaerae]